MPGIREEIREFRKEWTQHVNEIHADLADLRQRFDRGCADMVGGVAEMSGRFDGILADQQRIIELLSRRVNASADSRAASRG